jgi:hypothetical protein
MGQAKQRGTYSERKSLAIQRNATLLQEVKNLPEGLKRKALELHTKHRGVQSLANLLIMNQATKI